ncbi:hypothetical protein BT69DRAFT_1216194 [Atractiella rhizophila]|nr:hypothetical protein BT69DRAFT_1216194 [Atractiella rhizophila]
MFGIGDFGDLGRERKKKEKGLAPAPEEMLGKSARELNRDYWRKGEIPSTTKDGNGGSGASTPVAGSAGSSWRITKLKRLYEAHEDDPSIPLEELAIDRFGSMEAFRAVEEEKRIVDAREDRRSERKGGAGGGKGSYFSSEPGGGSRMGPRYSFEGGSGMRSSSFRKPGESPLATPTPSGAQSRQASKPSTPVPSVFTPTQATLAAVSRQSSKLAAVDTMSSATMETMTRPLVDPEGKKVKELEKEYEDALAVGVREEMPGELENGGKEVRVLPTLDGRGRLYDVGTGQGGEDGEGAEDKRARKKRRGKKKRDMKTGEVLRYNKDDDSMTLEELVRQERFGGGAATQKNLDSELASRITKDGKFEDDLDYMDDNADRLARKKMKTDAMKRRFAVQDFARTKKALENCSFCYGDDGVTLPKAGMVALGTRAYLAVTEFEELTEGHCIIVPLQHHLNMLEADDETWEEVKNFMKTLMQMFASQDKGVIFFETVISFKQQRHTFVECIPVPWSLYDDSPAYFKEAIVTSEEEWSQHKKLIDFEKRGWRRSMVATLPYFAVWWDYKANKGYGHVIEGVDGPEGGGDGYEDNEQRSGGAEFPRYFATEIIGNMLELEPRRWRKPRRIDRSRNPERVKAFQKMYDSFNWTKMLKEE